MRTRRTLLIILSLLSAVTGMAQIEGPLRVSSSELLLPTESDGEFGNRRNILVDARPGGGFCTAWVDSRQGGVVMAARITSSGELLDPMGLPVSTGGQPEPLHVMATGSGCMVVHRSVRGYSPADVVGTFIPWDEPAPEERFRINMADQNAVYASSPNELIMVSHNRQEGIRVRRITPDGTVHLRVLPSAFPMALTLVGERPFLLTRNSLQKTTLWEIDQNSELVRISDYEVRGDSLQMYARNDAVVIVSVSYEPLLHAVTIGTDGTVISEASLPLDWSMTSTVGTARIGGHDRLFISQVYYETSELRTVALDPDTLTVNQTFPFRLHAVGQAGSSAIYFYDVNPQPSWENRLRYELSRGFPSGTGTALTTMPHPEVVADSAAEGNRLVILHAEYGSRYEATLYVSLAASSRPTNLEPIKVASVPTHRLAAVAIRDQITMVAWVDQFGLWYRRLGPEHRWLDSSPQLLSPGPAGIGADALISTDEGFLIVWGELEERSLRMTTISLAGERTDRTLSYQAPSDEYHDQTPMPTAVERWRDGYVVVGRDATPPQCDLCTCPPPSYEIFGLQFDDDWNLVGSLLEDLGENSYFYTDNFVGLITSPDSLLITSSWRSYLIEPAVDGSFEARPIEIPLESGTGLWYGEAYLLVGRADDESTSDYYGNRSYRTTAVVFRPEIGAVTVHPLVDDFTFQVLSYQPRLVAIGERLYVIGSEVSRDGAEGTVRRLRLHELEEGGRPERRRAVRR